MLATDLLESEHRNIERMLALMDKATEKLDEGQKVPSNFFTDAVDFIKNYADKKHHGKEEEILFAGLTASGLPKETGPLAVMEQEHEQGRNFVKNLAKACEQYSLNNESAKSDIIHNSRGYIKLLTSHIKKEDTILYPMANKMLSQLQLDDINKQFQEVEKNLSGQEEQYQKMLSYWEQKLS